MIDLGLSKLALIGVVALVVIGPERLPKVARTAGALLGRAQRYVNEVKAEVGREMELEDLKRMRSEFERAASEVKETVDSEMRRHEAQFNEAWSEATQGLDDAAVSASTGPGAAMPVAKPVRRNGRDSWRVKRGARPMWFKKSQGVRTRAESGAARVKRHRPAKRTGISFF